MAKKWTIASARQGLPTLVGMAAREPQRVYRRDKLVAAVVSPELADELQRAHGRPPLGEILRGLSELCATEDYELPAPVRRDRSNPLTVSARTSSASRRRKR